VRTIGPRVAGLLLILVIAGCGSSSGGTTASTKGLTTVTVGVGPFYDYQPVIVAQKLGLDHQVGLNLKFESFPDPPLAQLETGAIDIGFSCDSCFFMTAKNFPTYRDFITTNQFRGFVLIGRKGKVTPYSVYVARNNGNLAAAKREFVLQQVKGKTFAIDNATDLSTVQGLLAQAGLTVKDVKILNFADDEKSAAAFVSGTGDFYTGALPQEARLLYSPEFNGQYVEAAGQQAFGEGVEGGVYYSTMASTQTWLSAHPTAAKEFLAMWYRAVQYLHDDPKLVLPMISASVQAAVGGVFPASVTHVAMTQLNYFPTFDEARTAVYGASSPTYYLGALRYQAKEAGAAGQIPSGTSLESFETTAGSTYEQLAADPKLVSYVNAPVP
jgi:ABC-type nitrate/sulfonate/bicarbonate transport system substrate-binding protein